MLFIYILSSVVFVLFIYVGLKSLRGKKNYKKNSLDRSLEKLTDKNKNSMLVDYEKNYDIQEKNLNLISDSIRYAESKNFQDIKLVWNIAGYINIISYDLKIITRDLTFSRNDWQKRFYARQASLIIYEAINDLFKLLGKDFVELTKNRLDISEFQDDLKNVRKDLNIFKETYSEKLETIRNVATAHRDKDVLKQIETIRQINWAESLQMITKFDGIINNLAKVIMKAINKGLNI